MFVKKVSAAAALTLFWAGIWLAMAPSARAAELVDRIAATVNEDIIMLSEVEEALKAYSQKILAMGYEAEKERSLLARARRDVIEQLISQRLTDQQVKRLNMSVTEKDVDKTIDRILESNSITRDQLNDFLAKEGATPEAYRKQIKDQLLRSKLVNIEVKSKILVTRDEIEAHYRRNIEKYGGTARIHLRTLLIRVPEGAAPEKKQAAKQQMEAIAKALQDGKAPETPEVERIDLGWFNVPELSPRIQDMVKGLKAGQFTGVLDVEQGFQVILVDELEEQAGGGLDKVSAQIEEDLYRAKVDEKFTNWLNELRQRSHIKILD